MDEKTSMLDKYSYPEKSFPPERSRNDFPQRRRDAENDPKKILSVSAPLREEETFLDKYTDEQSVEAMACNMIICFKKLTD